MATVVTPVTPPVGKQAIVGLALSTTDLCAVPRSGTARLDAWRTSLHPLNGDGSGWPALTSALQELARVLDVSGGRLEVALMPPFTEIRRLELPPLADAELRTLLARNAAKFFVGARAPQIVGTVAAPQAKAGANGVIAAAAPMRLIAALHAAARDAGWTVDAISPAEGTWCSANASLWPAASRHEAHLLVCAGERTELLQMDQGRLVGVRRFRAGAADAALVALAIGGADGTRGTMARSRVAAVGAAAPREELARALAGAGVTVAPVPPEWVARAEQPDALAAAFAGPNAAPLLRTEATLASRRAHQHTMVTRVAAASVVLLLGSALLALWGAKRQLHAVQSERAVIRPQISATLVGRTSVENAYRQLAALASAQRTAVQWSAVIAGVSAHLDGDAHLTAFRGRGDSVTVEGVAKHASKAFYSLVGMPGLTGVYAPAPVRRESPLGAPALERFTIAAVVAPRATPSVARKAAP